MTARLFPPHVTTEADALDYLPVWAELFGGVLRDGVYARRRRDGKYHVDEFHIDFPAVETILTVTLVFDGALVPDFYKFDLRRSEGALLWREDNHPGHEHEHGARCHPHIGPEENHRVPAPPATLASIAEKVVVTHISIG